MDIPPFVQTALTALIGLIVGSLYKHALDYFKAGKEWRTKTGEKIDKLADAQQSTMRATLIHNSEKYFERGWITPEERASWCDMHDRYSALGFNGLIDTYRSKINQLPDRNID